MRLTMERIWNWLPARTDRRRVSMVQTIAANLDLSPTVVAAALDEMVKMGCATVGGRYDQDYHRLLPLPWLQPSTLEQDTLC